MGISIGFSRCDYDPPAVTSSTPNPNPRNFTIKNKVQVNGKWVVKVNYHDCTNYEGDKIMVFEDEPTGSFIDPHFCDSKEHASPIARFEPTDRGWTMALKFCNL